jgi:hypothetical protein
VALVSQLSTQISQGTALLGADLKQVMKLELTPEGLRVINPLILSLPAPAPIVLMFWQLARRLVVLGTTSDRSRRAVNHRNVMIRVVLRSTDKAQHQACGGGRPVFIQRGNV